MMIQKLVRELDHAVAAEQYERAAQLRDRLNSLEAAVRIPGQATPDPTSPGASTKS
jgi:protein-arginine kinase activator protein McsA